MTIQYGKNVYKFDFPDLCVSTDVRPNSFNHSSFLRSLGPGMTLVAQLCNFQGYVLPAILLRACISPADKDHFFVGLCILC